MIRESYLAVVARNEDLHAEWASEPCECSWASEAIFFVRVLGNSAEAPQDINVRVQISPDGLHWADEGTQLGIPANATVVFAKLRHFGGWLRLASLAMGGGIPRVIVYLSLKG